MSDEQNVDGVEETNNPSELDLLKERADLMGIEYHPNIGAKKLSEKIAAKLENAPLPTNEEADTIQAAQDTKAGSQVPAKAVPTPQQQRMARRDKALRLVRIRLTCMNPLKGNMKGEIFSAGNSEIGMIKKFVPFNAEQGWHVPNIIFQMIKNKKYMSHYEVKVGNKKIKKNRLVPEYAVEVLPPLTPKELEDLKQRQLMAQGKND